LLKETTDAFVGVQTNTWLITSQALYPLCHFCFCRHQNQCIKTYWTPICWC